MSTPFPNELRLIVNGDPVAATIVNSPLMSLGQRTQSLKEAIDNALIGSATVLREQPLAGDFVKVGMAVYQDANGVFQPGIVDFDYVGGNATSLKDSAYVWGILFKKNTPTSGDIVTNGVLLVSAYSLGLIVDGGVARAGPLFLTARNGSEGKLTYQKPAVGIAVGFAQGPDAEDNYRIVVNIGWDNPLEAHIHYGTRVSNSSSNWQSAAAWAAANSRVAPTGSVWRYLHENDSGLATLWPPIPISAVAYDLNGTAADLVLSDQIRIDDDGIWWMTSSNSFAAYRHDFYFTRMSFKTNLNVVTALHSNSAQLTVTNAAGVSSNVGSLYIDLDLSLGSTSSNVYGSAVKEVDGTTVKVGPVVDGIRTDTPEYLTVTSDATFVSGGNTFHKGLTKLTVQPPTAPREGLVEFVNLSNVDVENFNNTFYLAMKQSVVGEITSKLHLPVVGVPEDVDTTIELTILGRIVGTTPTLSIDYMVIPYQAAAGTPSAIPTTFTSAGTVTGVAIATINSYYRTSFTIPVTMHPGDILYYRITRNGTAGYSGDIGIMAQRWSTEVA